jgi:hypothetical protein
VEEVKDVEDEDSVVVESSFGARPASFGTVVGGYDSLVNTQNEQKKTTGNLCCRPLRFFRWRGREFHSEPAAR